MQPTILITGGAGYIGSHTAYLMANKGYNVIVIDNFRYNQPFSLYQETQPYPVIGQNRGQILAIQDDFANTQTLDSVFKNHHVEAVMHFAALIEVGQSVKEPAEFYENNVTKTLTLLNTMLKHQVKTFIFSSSCAIYGEPKQIPIPETHGKKPLSPYGHTKWVTEMALQDYATAYGLQYVALRYFNAAGALPELGLGEYHEPETHLIPLLLRAAVEQKPFSIFGTDHATPDGTCVRDYLHVLDIADAHLKALEHLQKGNPSDCFNLGTGKGISVKQMVQAVEKLLKTKLILNLAKARAGDPATLVADPSKAQAILQWQPKHSDIEQILTSAYAFECLKKQCVTP